MVVKQTTHSNDPAALLDKQATAARLHVSLRTLDELRERQELPFYKIGRSVRFAVRDLDAFLAARRFDAAKPRPAFRRRSCAIGADAA